MVQTAKVVFHGGTRDSEEVDILEPAPAEILGAVGEVYEFWKADEPSPPTRDLRTLHYQLAPPHRNPAGRPRHASMTSQEFTAIRARLAELRADTANLECGRGERDRTEPEPR